MQAVPEDTELSVIKVQVDLPPLPFPTPDDLKPGMTKLDMISKFGVPRLAAS